MPEAPMARDGSTKPSRGCRCPASSPASAWSPKDNRGRLHWSLVATTDSTAALEWLLASDEPAIGYLARREILGDRVEPDSEAILAGPIASALLSGQKPTAASAAIPYKKWTGAHWRLASLVELGVPAGHPPAVALEWRTIRAWSCSPARSSSGSGPTEAGIAIRMRAAAGRRSTNRCRRARTP